MKLKVIIGLTIVGVLSGCLDTTAPAPRTEFRLAHLAPGAGTFSVGLDGSLLLDAISPLQYTLFALDTEAHMFSFQNAGTGASTSVETPDSDIVAVLLMDAAAPQARAYGLTRTLDEQRLVVVNADTAAADLTVLLAQEADTTTVTLAPGAGETVGLKQGAVTLAVHRGDIAQAVSLPGFSLQAGDHGFLAIYPPADEAQRYATFLF